MKLLVFVVLICLAAPTVLPQPAVHRTYCNPMDIDNRYNFERIEGHSSYRSGADPVIVNHKGEYYPFVTNSGGWWHSKDLGSWEFVRPNIWPEGDDGWERFGR
jgi:xylan 1,4-beta-xylosidase